MEINVINLNEKFSLIHELHKQKAIARMNNYLFKIVRFKRENVWHSHPETDEVFFVIDGELTIALRDKTLILQKGEMVSIPAGVEHRPSSTEECHILLIEPAATVNTGNARSDMTDTDIEWI